MTTARHPNRTGLRAVAAGTDGSAAAGTSALACRCSARVVAGTVWAYDTRLGWHDPVEHDTWTPPRQPSRSRLPDALQSWTAPARPGHAPSPAPASRRHALAPAGRGLVVCTSCGLAFDAGACTRSGRPLPTCQSPSRPDLSRPAPSVPSSPPQEDA